MKFTFTEREQRFRTEVRSFIHQEVKPHYDNPPRTGAQEYEAWYIAVIKRVARKLGARGWLALGLPEEYGGRPATPGEAIIFKEEMGYYESWGVPRQAVNMVVPTLLLHGTEDQKRRFLPAIARGEMWWCQGYSEPGAGSDLAALQTTALPDGDAFRVTGRKIWTSGACYADWVFFLARTDADAPRHKGISFLLAEMRTPGIGARPITQMHGASDDFAEVLFDEARVPRENLVGGLNQGWQIAMGQLGSERAQIDFVATLKRHLDDLTSYVKEAAPGGTPQRRRTHVRHRLADLHVEWEVARLLNYRVAWMHSAGLDPGAEASVCKVVVGTLSQRLAATAIQALGLYGQLGRYGEEAPRAPLGGKFMTYYLRSVSRTFNAGTHEVQKNIIATRGLGLPR